MLFIQKIKLLTSKRFFIRGLRWKFIENQVNKIHVMNKVVVDLGAGKMPYKKLFKDCKYVAVDIENRTSDQNLMINNFNKNIQLQNSYADIVICTEVLEHLHEPNIFIKEINRILKPNGTLILTVPFVWPIHEIPNDYFRYTKFQLENFFNDAGFTNFKIVESNGDFTTVLQLVINQMKSKFWLPVIVILNFLCFYINKIEKAKDLPLGYYVVASK